jgi:hypothetical protein
VNLVTDRHNNVSHQSFVLPMKFLPRFALGQQFATGLLAVLLTAVTALAAEDAVRAPRFDIEVAAVLSKAGCNQGACHGNASGKGGLKLSLRGQDLTADYRALILDHAGRRVNTLEPDQSLLLSKPSMGVAHEGGLRLPLDSPEYQVLRQWIAQGAMHEPAKLKVQSLQVTPKDTILQQPEQRVQLKVTATFSDQSTVDVTRWCCYDSSDPRVKIDLAGQVTITEPGETMILVRYLNAQRPVRVALIPQREQLVLTANQQVNRIDDFINQRLQQLRIEPSPLVDDAQFLRRAMQDLLGVIPTVAELQEFQANTRANKRELLIEELLKRPEYSEYWAMRWADILRVEERTLDQKGTRAIYEWLRASFASNRPLNEMARELVASQGSTYESPTANYYRALRDPVSRSEATAQIFLGTRLQCAKCHNHPFDRWTQDDYHEWTAVFAGIDYEIIENKRRDKNDSHEFIGEQLVKHISTGTVKNPRTEQNAPPRFLGSSKAIANDEKRLTRLADWLTSPDNKQFAKAQVNRLWYYLLGRGLVDPVDDFRAANPASHPELLEYLATEFITHNFDQQHLLRLIMNSATYQRSSATTESNQADEIHYARRIPQRVPAEVLLDHLTQVTGSTLDWNGLPDGLRSVQRPGISPRRRRDPSGEIDKFLRAFGKPPRLTNCECERGTAVTVTSAFQLLSGPVLNELLTQPDNRLGQWASDQREPEVVLTEIWLTILSRVPSSQEREKFSRLWQESKARRQTVEDIVWALINSHEFQLKR